MYSSRFPFFPPPMFIRRNQNTFKQTFNKATSNIPYLKDVVSTEPPPKPQANNGEVIFEIFGLKIYFDDLLIICILLFLYQEGIKDEYLFISLILLLLS